MKQIWASELRNEMNVGLIFELDVTPDASSELKIASCVPFRVCVDGELIGFGPRRMAHGHAAVNHHALGRFCDKQIKLTIESVSYRTDGFYIPNQVPFVAAELNVGDKTYELTDFAAFRDGARLQKVQRYSFQRGFVQAYDFTRKRERVETDELTVCALHESTVPYVDFKSMPAVPFENGTLFEAEDYPIFDDEHINRAHTQGFKREEQELRVTAIYDRLGRIKTGSGNTTSLNNSYINYKLDRLAAGFISMEINAHEQTTLQIVYDELINPSPDRAELCKNGAVNLSVREPFHSVRIITLTLPEGKHRFMSIEPDTMQYISVYAVSGNADITDVSLITYENSCVTAKFKCEDKTLCELFEAGVNTFKPNAVDVLTDCASRERAGWLCDSFFTARAEYFLTGHNYVEENLLRAFIDRPSLENIPDEVFPMCYPADQSLEGNYIPNWCMWLILELYSCRFYRGGDPELTALFEQKTDDFINFMLKYQNSDGLLENLDSWVFVEWSRANDLVDGVNYPTNMLFSATLKAAAKLFDNERYFTIAERMDEAILTQSKRGIFFVDNAVRGSDGKLKLNDEWTETCQYYAFFLGYASKETDPELYEVMFERALVDADGNMTVERMSPSNVFIGLYLRFDYLSSIGEHQKVVDGLVSTFSYQIEKTRTLWEYLDPNKSLCHGFASIVCVWLDRYVRSRA